MTEGKRTPGMVEAKAFDDPRWAIIGDTMILAVTVGGNDEANARYFATAWNTHDRLVAALEGLLPAFSMDSGPDKTYLIEVFAAMEALAAAKEAKP